LDTTLTPGGNLILVGAKSLEDYSFAILHAFNDGFPSVIVEGLGERCGKTIRVAKDVCILRPEIVISRIDSFEKSNPKGRVKGVQVVLKKGCSTPEIQTAQLHIPKLNGARCI
jgi:DNA-binding protein